MQSFLSSAVLLYKRDKIPSLVKLWMLQCSEQPPRCLSLNSSATASSELCAGNEGLADSRICRHSIAGKTLHSFLQRSHFIKTSICTEVWSCQTLFGHKKKTAVVTDRKSAWISWFGTRKTPTPFRTTSRGTAARISQWWVTKSKTMLAYLISSSKTQRLFSTIPVQTTYFNASCQKSETRGFTSQHMTTTQLCYSWDAGEERKSANTPHHSPHTELPSSILGVRRTSG